MDEIQKLNLQIERLKRELEASRERELKAKKEIQHLEGILKTVVQVLASFAISKGR